MDTSLLFADIQTYIDFKEVSFKGLVKFFEPFTVEKGEHFYKPNIIPEFGPYVLKGCFRQYTLDENGQEQTILFAEENSWPGLFGSMLKKIPSNTGLIALEDSEVLGITIENFYHLWELYPEFGKYIMIRDDIDRKQRQETEDYIKSVSPEEAYKWLLIKRPSLVARLDENFLADYIRTTPEKLHQIKVKSQL